MLGCNTARSGLNGCPGANFGSCTANYGASFMCGCYPLYAYDPGCGSCTQGCYGCADYCVFTVDPVGDEPAEQATCQNCYGSGDGYLCEATSAYYTTTYQFCYVYTLVTPPGCVCDEGTMVCDCTGGETIYTNLDSIKFETVVGTTCPGS